MAIVGQRPNRDLGKGYENDPIKNLASTFRDLAKNVLTESGVNLFATPQNAFMLESTNETMKNFFIENSAVDAGNMTPEELEEHCNDMGELYENDRQAVMEYANVGAANPVIGMSFPIHKNILMNNIFDRGAIQKAVAVSPKFTISMETRYLVTPDGQKIDMFREQNKMTAAMNATVPFVPVTLKLPEFGMTDVLAAMGASSLDNISIESYISAVLLPLQYKTGDVLPDGTTAAAPTVADTWVDTHLEFNPAYGEYDRQIMQKVVLPVNTDLPKGSDGKVLAITEDVISGTMKENRFQLNSLKGIVKSVRLLARKDTSNGLTQPCSVKWDVNTTIEEIPSAVPINTPISPEEVKDIAALYNVNQLTKVMSLFKEVLENYKDDMIRTKLDESYATMRPDDKFKAKFDFAPREGYLLDHIEWRNKTFMDALDSHITDLLQVLNDPNMTISVFGRPDLIRKISPVEYTFQTPSSVGPVEINFVKTVTTSEKRTYQFISSQKLNGSDELIIILCPRNSQRIVYRIYDYQMYVSNEIRNAAYNTLPAIHAFERWKFVSYQPVQGRMTILNPSGLRA